jgi:hypothetical protein
MRREHTIGVLGLVSIVLITSTCATETDPPASTEVAAAIQPYLDRYKLAGVIGIIADKSGKVHYKNLLGYADVEAKKPISEDNVFWIASMTKDQDQLQPRLSSPQRHVWPRRSLRHGFIRQPQDRNGGHLHGAMHRRRPMGGPRSVSQDGHASLSKMNSQREFPTGEISPHRVV